MIARERWQGVETLVGCWNIDLNKRNKV